MTQWNKYAPTAARKHVKPGRDARPKSVTIDVHSHVGVPRAAEIVREHLAPDAMPLVTFSDAATKALNQKQEAKGGWRTSMPWASPRHAGDQAAAASVLLRGAAGDRGEGRSWNAA